MIFTKKAALRQLLFVVLIFALLIPTAIWDSNSQVKVRFDSDIVHIKCDRYKMDIQYSDIANAALVPMVEPGQPGKSAHDNDIVRTGTWTNEDWGEYIIVADLDTTTCIKLDLHDGRTLVFCRKNDKATAEDFELLQSHLSP